MNTPELLESLILALQDTTRAVEDLQIAVLTLTQQLIPRIGFESFPPERDHRPIEDRGSPERTIQRDAE